ncbi:two-component system NarL family response regulator [Luteibacter sp. W1I16]|uniref:response regulator n=1 Tax=Luteibacter sp. W1I16 TaxID=3373922 RepID=UPI003D23E909
MDTDATSDRPIRILVADDHPALRHGVAAMIGYEGDMVVCAEAATGRMAVEEFLRTCPDLVLMDLQMPDMGGAEAIRLIRKHDPDARIIVLTTYSGDMHARMALSAGAIGYLLKGAIREELIATLRAAFGGHRRVTPSVATQMAQHFSDETLTPREIAVLQGISEGIGNRAIAEQLGISAGTVKDHVSNILDKLGAHNRAHAVSIAIKRGILSGDDIKPD